MGWFDRPTRVLEATAATPQAHLPGVYTGGGNVPTRAEFVSMNALWAMQVPAYSKGYRLISGTVAQLPLRSATLVPLLSQPELDRAPWVTLQRTVGDLIQYARAYWRIVSLDTNGRPRFVKHLDAAGITVEGNEVHGPNGETWTVSQPWTPARPGEVIVFTGFPDGTLIAGVDTIATALALEMTSQHYANSPHPADVLENVTNIDLSEEEIREQINTWMEARRNGDVAYLSGMKLGDAKGWSPTELALEPQRNQSALQVARLLNLDPMWVGASVSGSSLTYQNRVDARTDLYGLTLTDYIYPIEQRIGMPDCAGVPVWLDASEFLRANLDTRATMATGLFTAGIITLPESRDYVSDRPTGGPTP